jgi:hypothetical protein
MARIMDDRARSICGLLYRSCIDFGAWPVIQSVFCGGTPA